MVRQHIFGNPSLDYRNALQGHNELKVKVKVITNSRGQFV